MQLSESLRRCQFSCHHCTSPRRHLQTNINIGPAFYIKNKQLRFYLAHKMSTWQRT